jgi:hypothetical protein
MVRMMACHIARYGYVHIISIVHDEHAHCPHAVLVRCVEHARSIQAAVRGWLARRLTATRLLGRSGPPVSRTLRRIWAAGRLGASCVALQAMLQASSTTIDDLMQQVDAGLTQLRVGQAALQATGMAA